MNNHRRRIIDDLSTIIEEAAFNPDHWQVFADRFCELIPGAKALFLANDRQAYRDLPLVHSGFENDAIKKFAEHYGTISGWTPFNLALPVMTLRRTEDYLPSSSFRNTEFYTDFLRHLPDSDAATAIKLSADRERSAEFVVHYAAQDNERINLAVEPVMRTLAPAMKQALSMLRIRVADGRAASRANIVEAILDPAFVLSSKGRVLAANRAARALADEATLLRIAPGDRLQFLFPQTAATVTEQVAKVMRGQLLPVGHETIQARHEGALYSIAAHPMAPSARAGFDLLASPEPCLLLIIRPLLALEASASEVLRATFGLTAAEARLAIGLAKGASLSATAIFLGITYQTSRSQLKAVFAKLGVHRQSELVAVLHPLIGAL
ncbi:helix-turn-helix transcriptional regulator (plasmid) [Rhizobium sp. CB3171]|uniref:helix-turn-helix transcriptional regulator n=1 Tax=Rhizobium sp. CB3171 TaxID=3039157 RepID=UPI0024B06751|nr:helix-turn-helix transcriptional regulator [Rhizobium sp. CB3171]WFU07458.1 helix-turn-helix transcriptional regulator [Rhizobium sp. CB3171]